MEQYGQWASERQPEHRDFAFEWNLGHKQQEMPQHPMIALAIDT